MINFLDIDIYGTTFVFVVESTLDEWNNFYLRWSDKLSDDDNKTVIDTIKDMNYNGCCILTDKNDYIIYIRDKENNGDIAHEIFHACNRLLTKFGVTHDEYSEAWAYLIGYVTNKFYDMLETQKGSD